MHPNNNPLLSRLYETKSGKKKKRLNQSEEQISHRDKVLVPKLNKNVNQLAVNKMSDRQKTAFFKPGIVKLPPLSQKQIVHTTKEIPLSSSKKTTFRDRKVSWSNQTHDPLLFPTQLSIGTPVLEQKSKYQQQAFFYDKVQKEPKKLKTVTEQPNANKTEQQLFEYLKILSKNEELKEEFCYMNRGQLPYSFYIVDYNDVNQKQFLTVSLRGVSIYKDGQSQFTTVDKLSKQIELYRKVKKIEFFREYIIQKTFKHWRIKTVRRKFEAQCKIASKVQLSQNLIVQKYLQFLFNHTEDFVRCKFLDLRLTNTGTLQDLKKELKAKQISIQKSITFFENQIQKHLKQTIQKNLTKFRQQQRVSLTSDGKQGPQQSFLPYDSKKRTMKYTQMAKLKQFQASMYKLLKLTDFVRQTTKTLMIVDGVKNFAQQLSIIHEKFMKRKQVNFVSWVNMKITIKKSSKHDSQPSIFQCTPTLQSIEEALLFHLKNNVQKFYRKHYLLIENKNQYHCQSYEPSVSQFPTKYDFKAFIEQNKQIIALKNNCFEKVDLCINIVKEYLQKGQETLLKIYDQSFMTKNVNYYMQNQPLKTYLTNMVANRQLLNSFQPIVQFGLVYLDMTEALLKTKQKFQQKFKFISNAIPFEVVKRCQQLAQSVKQVYNIFKQNPGTIMEFIVFYRNYNQNKKKVQDFQAKIQQILELQDMVYKNGLKIGDGSKIHINQSSAYYRELQKRFEEIDTNQEKDRKKFYKMIDDMVDPLDQKSQDIYKRLYEDHLISNASSNTTKCLQKLAVYSQEFSKLKQKKQELFYYQNELKLGNKDLPNYFKLESALEWTIKLWKGRSKYEQFVNHINTKGYADKLQLSINQLKQFMRDLQSAQSQVQYVQLLHFFKQDTIKILNILQTCRMLSAQTLQEQHKKVIKERLETKSKKIKDYIFTIEGGRSIICNQLISETNIMEIKELLEQTVHASAQQSIIKRHIQQNQQFCKKSKIVTVSSDLAKNGTQIYHFGVQENQKLQQKIGYFLMLFKNIIGSKHAIGQLHIKVTQQIKICEYLKKFIQKWIEVEKQWIKLLPLMTNCPSVKHQSNVYFQFTSVDNHMRKHNRQVHDVPFLKKFSDDYVQKRFLNLMENCERELVQINKIFNNFLQMKRNTYHRFFFLADQQLISILQNVKDGKSLTNYAGYCFNCDKLSLDKELVAGFETSSEVLKLKKANLKGEPDEMFKSLQDNMKSSVKSAIMSLIPKMRVGLNIQQQISSPLQAMLVADKFFWSEMSQHYLNPITYDYYELFIRRQCDQLLKYVKKPDLTADKRYKISVRLIQAMGLRQIGEQLLKLQVTKQDFKWKQQLKYSIQQQQIIITQFNRKLVYGLQYYPPSKVTVPTNNYHLMVKQIFQTSIINKALVVTGVEGDGKRNMIFACAQQLGSYYKELVCNKNISFQYILRFMQGAILAGAWLSFYEFEHLENQVLVKLLSQVKKVANRLNKNQQAQPSLSVSGKIQQQKLQQCLLRIPTNNIVFPSSQKSVVRANNRVMFNFVTHGFYPQKVSVHQFDSFVLSEPSHKKICEWLLQANCFAEWQTLSTRLISFLQTVFPFLQRVMGSFMSILRKVIDNASQKKRLVDIEIKQTQILVLAFKQQVLQKSDGNIQPILYQALRDYFYCQIPEDYQIVLSDKKANKNQSPLRRYNGTVYTKMGVLKSLILKKTKNILVIGPRTNKSRVIRQACVAAQKQILSIYPQSIDFFFHDETIQKLNKLNQNQIIHYDGQSILRQWNDLVISGYLLMEGKKIHLHNQLIIQLRQVNNCSPSFVGSCQLVYIGNLSTKRQKFERQSQAELCQSIMEPMLQIFGQQLQNLPDHLLETFAQFLKPYAKDPKAKNYHKLIIWFGNVLGIEGLWNKFYGGRYYDFTVSKYSHELVPIDQSKYQPIQQSPGDSLSKIIMTMGNLLVHTKDTILLYQLFKNLMQISKPIILTGKHDSGKTTILKLFFSNLKALSTLVRVKTISSQQEDNKKQNQNENQKQQQQQQNSEVIKINLNIKFKTQVWTKILKSSLTNIRREGKNYLVNVGDNDAFVVIDDLDLGMESHREYLRQLIDVKSIHDGRFQEYNVEKMKIVVSWLKQRTESLQSTNKSLMNSQAQENYKLFDRMIELKIPQFSRESLSTIIRTNIQSFMKKNNLSKQVINFIQSGIIKSLLVGFDDVLNLNGSNSSANIMLAVMRNLISLPRKNVLMSADNYMNYFKNIFKQRLLQKCFTPKSRWQIKSVYENILKIAASNLQPTNQQSSNRLVKKASINNMQGQQQQQESISYFHQKMYKQQLISKLKQKINATYPSLYIFDDLLKLIVRLNNQIHSIDNNCILIGRTGTGKQTILQIVAFLNKVHICNGPNKLQQSILKCLNGKQVILQECYLRRNFTKFIYNGVGTQYQKIQQCMNDQDLQHLITGENYKKQYLQLVTNIPNREVPHKQTKVLNRVKDKLKSILVFDGLSKYKEALNKYRELNRYYVCYIDQWPAQALLNISGVNIITTQMSQKVEANSESPKKYLQVNVPKLLAEVFAVTNRIMQIFEQSSISIKLFKTYIKIFQKMYDNRYQQLSEKIQFYSKIYNKFHDACVLIDQWQRRIDILRVQLQEGIAKLDQELKTNRAQSFTFGILYKRRQVQEQALIQKNEQMAQLKRNMEKQLQGMKKLMEGIEKIVGSMQRTEMSELKKIYKNSKVVSFGLQCLCLLLGEESSQKSINKILADPNLMMKMKSQTTLETKNPKIIQKFKIEFDSIKEQYEQKPKTQASRILIDWLKAILQYWKILTEHQSLSSQYKTHKKTYEQSIGRQKQIQQSIKQLKQKAIKLNQNFQSLFKKKEQNLQEYNSINRKLINANKILPSLKKSQQQTWQYINILKNDLTSLLGNLILTTTCIVYLPLKRLRMKKDVLDDVKKLLNQKMIEFSSDFMSPISGVQDAVLQDLNLTVIKQLQQFPVLIVDPERRALSFLFDQDPHLAATVISKNFSDLTSSIDIMTQMQKHKNQNNMNSSEQVLEHPQNKIESKQSLNLQESIQINVHDNQSDLIKYKRKTPIMHTTQQNFKFLLQKLPQDTFLIDWKFTTIDTNQKIFLRIAAAKRPQYFEVKKQLNRKIKKDIKKIEEYKREIYQTINKKQIKVLDDIEFVELGTKLMNLQIQTQKNRQLQKQKIEQIKQYAKQINEQVVKVSMMVNTLKKIKNVALDLVLDVACSNGNALQNIIKWVLATISPSKRLSWLLALAMEYNGENNQQLLNVLIKDSPLKINQIARNKKPIAISNKNFENMCKLSNYTPNLKAFSQAVLRNPKQFQHWTHDNTQTIPQIFKPQILTLLEELTVIKITKPKILLAVIKKLIRSALKIQQLQGYTNKQLILRTNKKFPIIVHCAVESLNKLCQQLNGSRIVFKSLVQIQDTLQMKKFIWAQMNQQNWVVLHSIFNRNTRQTLQDIIEYVSNYEEQQNFRIFIYLDQVQLLGYQNYNQITTKYNNISARVSHNTRNTKTEQQLLIRESKYIQNIGVQLFEQIITFQSVIKQLFDEMEVEPFQVNEVNQQNQSVAAMLIPQSPFTPKIPSNTNNKPSSPLNTSLLVSNLLTSTSMTPAEKQKHYIQKVCIHISILEVAVWMKFSKSRMHSYHKKIRSLLSYIKQYAIPIQFNLYAISGYLSKMYSTALQSPQRLDVHELCERIIDETKVNEKSIFGIPTTKQGIAMALAGIGRAGVNIGKNWLDLKLRNNEPLLGCEQSYLTRRNAYTVQTILQTLGDIKFYNRSIKQQANQIRTALARLPTNLLVFSREVKSIIFLHCYFNQLRNHNKSIVAARQFLEWVNIASNQELQQDQTGSKGQTTSSSTGDVVDAFSKSNLCKKIKQFTDIDVQTHKIGSTLTNWLQNLKRRHDMLLYWNLDNPVLVLHPVLLTNFSMVVSTYVINYLTNNYEKIKLQAQSINQDVLYTLQIQFSRQTDQKQLYMTQGILLPDLLYRQFKYNFEYKMLDGIVDWSGEDQAPLIMLKMKKMPTAAELALTSKDRPQDYHSPEIQISTRINNKLQIVYKIKTYIDGHFQDWSLRRPMLVSQ